jgi:hypothetical protein
VKRHGSLAAFFGLVLLVALLSLLGPREAILGSTVRLIYLHGAWVWTALFGFAAACAVGLAGLVARRPRWLRWAWAAGLAGTFYWITYLPLSLWAMQAAWNGLFLEEPRWRLGLDFAVIAFLVQAALLLFGRPAWAAAAHVALAGSLLWRLSQTKQVMHPPSPITSSESLAIRVYFGLLVLLCVAAAWQLARWLAGRLPQANEKAPEALQAPGA